MSPADRQWVGQFVFVSGRDTAARFQLPMKLWYSPPPTKFVSVKPVPEKYFLRRLFLWMPRMMYFFNFKCPNCKRSAQSKGIYNKVRLVLDIKDYYYLATEYMGCTCGKTFLASDKRMLEQLPYHMRVQFPAILTYQYACDNAVISLFKSRTLGNSSHALKNTLLEMHSEQ